MYQSIDQLPQPVLQLLDDTERERFRSTYNLAEIETGDPQQALQRAWSSTLSATGGADNFGYLIDVSSLKLDEGGDGWFQAFPFGKWHHPLHGVLEMTREKAEQMVQQFKDKVTGQDLDIDYDHKAYHGGAAGWIKDAKVGPDGLYLVVEWTRQALSDVKNRVYRYFSPEIASEWTHPVTQVKYTNVLRGGAITNRPFLKGIQPINLSEAVPVGVGEVNPKLSFNTGGNRMPMSAEQLATARKNLGLPDTADEAAVTQAALEKAVTLSEPPANNGGGQSDPPANSGTDNNTTDQDALIALAEQNPVVKNLVEQVATLQASQKLSEINVRLSEWQRPEKDRPWGLPTVVTDKLRTFMLSETPQRSTQFTEIMDTILKTGLVKLTETPWRTDNSNNTNYDDPGAEADKRVAKLMETDKNLKYPQALERVFAEDTQLANAYINQ